MCAPFAKDIRYIFENFEEDIQKSKGFSNTIRSLLVNNIMNNINMSLKIKSEEKTNETIAKIIVEAGLTDSLVDSISSSTMSFSSASFTEQIEPNKIKFSNYFKVSTGIIICYLFIFILTF